MAVDDVSEGAVACASCGDVMERRGFERALGGREAIDLCYPCRSIWFDQGESTQLAPRGVLELFGVIHKHQAESRRPLANKLACPHCRSALALTHDIGKSGPFTYYRCGAGHGRLTPFTEFLREKQFIRALTPAELARVRVEVKQVRCSGCGGAIDLEHDTACPYCHAPIAILDADAVEKALRSWSEEAARKDELRVKGAQAAAISERMAKLPEHCFHLSAAPPAGGNGIDLIDGAIAAIGGLLQGIGLEF